MIGVRVRNNWKEEIMTVTEVLFRILFVGNEKNHENLVIAGGMVEFRREYKFTAIQLQQPAGSEVLLCRVPGIPQMKQTVTSCNEDS